MDSSTKSKELSYYELYLLSYLQKYHPEKAGDTEFIKQRADGAAEVLEAESEQDIPVRERAGFAIKALPNLNKTLSGDDEPALSDSSPYTEATGAISLYLEEYGV